MKRRITFLILLLTLIGAARLQAKSQNATKGLLSDTINVVHYDLQLDLTSISSQQIRGRATIRLTTPMNNIGQIPLSLLQLTVDSVLYADGSHLNFTHANGLLRVASPLLFSAGDTLTIQVYYEGTPFHEAWRISF